MSPAQPISDTLSIAVEVEPGTNVTRTIFDGLLQSNTECTGDGRITRLCVTARDLDNTLVGGIYGEIYWGWLNVLALWVTPQMRHQGIGTKLLSHAEAEALAKGCEGAFLDTFTFQNVALYTRAGYEIFGTLEHFPNGHSRHFLRKHLHAA
jgi:GNAT superfamily N-acetyltransferase